MSIKCKACGNGQFVKNGFADGKQSYSQAIDMIYNSTYASFRLAITKFKQILPHK